jgi:hypothetical protein
MTWTYGIKIFTSDDIKSNYGFVYIITNTVNDKKYIGKKWFWSLRKKKIKGKKRAKRIKLESDWKDYYGSSADLIADIVKYGKDKFKREILILCKTKGDASYHEARLQFEYKVLESDQYYNQWIICKVRKNHISR